MADPLPLCYAKIFVDRFVATSHVVFPFGYLNDAYTFRASLSNFDECTRVLRNVILCNDVVLPFLRPDRRRRSAASLHTRSRRNRRILPQAPIPCLGNTVYC